MNLVMRIRKARGWLVVLTYLGAAQAQEKTYVGAEQCGHCHADVLAQQSRSGHAHSLYRATEHPLASYFVPESELLRKPAYHFQFSLSGKQFRVQAFDAGNILNIPVEWAFGAGDQAVTFVTRVNEDWYLEHYYSYYSGLRSLAPSPGHEAITPKTLPQAMGLPYKSSHPNTGIRACFVCHSTGPLSFGPGQEIQPAELGVRCEACHGPGSLHVQAAKEGQTSLSQSLIQRPDRLSAAELNRFCGTCHRSPPVGDGPSIDWNYAWNVRHQPIYLSQSACFQKSKGALTCLSCHDPHGPLRRNDAAYYDQTCRNCHGGEQPQGRGPQVGSRILTGPPPKAVCERRGPVNCTDCHMPRVTPQAGLQFSNHWIGIYGEGAKLKPSDRRVLNEFAPSR